jgi:hypothetical protein
VPIGVITSYSLVDIKIRVEVLDNDGRTPLHYAAINNRQEAAKLLVQVIVESQNEWLVPFLFDFTFSDLLRPGLPTTLGIATTLRQHVSPFIADYLT